jgi:membrane protease YdiL (CAAX protease family)
MKKNRIKKIVLGPAKSLTGGCPTCNAPIRGHAKFCGNCGQPIHAPKVQTHPISFSTTDRPPFLKDGWIDVFAAEGFHRILWPLVSILVFAVLGLNWKPKTPLTYAVSYLTSSALLVLSLWIFAAKTRGLKLRAAVGMTEIPVQGLFVGAGIGLLAAMISHTWIQNFGTNYRSEIHDLQAKYHSQFLLLFPIVLAPILEECSFRGFKQTRLAYSIGPIKALLVTSLWFGYIHVVPSDLNSLIDFVPFFLSGIFFGLVRDTAKCTAPAIAAHAGYNLIGSGTILSRFLWNAYSFPLWYLRVHHAGYLLMLFACLVVVALLLIVKLRYWVPAGVFVLANLLLLIFSFWVLYTEPWHPKVLDSAKISAALFFSSSLGGSGFFALLARITKWARVLKLAKVFNGVLFVVGLSLAVDAIFHKDGNLLGGSVVMILISSINFRHLKRR